MALAVEASGTQTATLDTEHVLATIATTKFLQLIVDANALAAGETLIVRVKTMVLAAGTTRQIEVLTIKGENLGDGKILLAPPFPSNQEAVFTLLQSGGTGRAFPWKVMSW